MLLVLYLPLLDICGMGMFTMLLLLVKSLSVETLTHITILVLFTWVYLFGQNVLQMHLLPFVIE